jgi:hypothetical protein
MTPSRAIANTRANIITSVGEALAPARSPSPWAPQMSLSSLEAGAVNWSANVYATINSDRISVMPNTDESTDLKIQASEARTETKIVRLEGKIDTLSSTLAGKLDSMAINVNALRSDISKSDQYNRDSRLLIMGTIVVAALALGGLVVAMATYGDALFGRGMSVRDVVQAVIKEQQAAPQTSPPRGNTVPR